MWMLSTHRDVLLLQEQEISLSAIDDSAPNKITADFAIMTVQSQTFSGAIQIFDLQGHLSEEMACSPQEMYGFLCSDASIREPPVTRAPTASRKKWETIWALAQHTRLP